MRKRLQDLNLLDDFLFGSVVTYPEIGERFIRELLRTVLGREFGRLTVMPQKVYYGSDTDLHGTRLDVYLEETPEEAPLETATIYDVEPDQIMSEAHRAELPKHVRFYHAKIDTKSLKSGESYRMLKRVIVIMITPYDPFGQDRMVYTIRSMCEEDPEMPYDDGARTLFLYTRGTVGIPTEELRQFLHYMEFTNEESITNESLRKIHEMIKTVKLDEEVSLTYMNLKEREEWRIQEAVEKAVEEAVEKAVEKAVEEAVEKERLRAEEAERCAQEAQKQMAQMMEEIQRLKQKLSLHNA